MIRFDFSKCIRCGLCAGDCFPGAITMDKEGPRLSAPQSCIECGHCVAVCPTRAAQMEDAEPPEPLPNHWEVQGDALLGLMRGRRSCRHFKPDPVPLELWHTLVDAARACPTAKNLQATRYIAVTERIPDLLTCALDTLGELGRQMLQSGTQDPNELRRANNFLSWQKRRREEADFDPLFFHAPLLLLFVSGTDTAMDAAAGAAYAELMAAAQGLGCLYSGYFTACCGASPEIRSMLGLGEKDQVARCLVLGYPDIRFQRTAPKKCPNITAL